MLSTSSFNRHFCVLSIAQLTVFNIGHGLCHQRRTCLVQDGHAAESSHRFSDGAHAPVSRQTRQHGRQVGRDDKG